MSGRLSLCMIVRDEMADIERCVESVAPWVDEIVIVDTGSVDGTYEWVQVRAHVHRQIEWPNHFAEARNTALDLATGDWVLIVDADERLAEGGPAIRAAIAQPHLLAAELRMRNELGDGETGDFWAIRLFRRLADIRFTGRIHEQVSGAIRARMVREPHWSVQRIDVTLNHLGYLPDRVENRGKTERNVGLLEQAIDELEADAPLHHKVYLEYKLATELGRTAAGQRLLLQVARRVIDADAAELSMIPAAAEILVAASQTWCRTGGVGAALEAARCAESIAPGHPMVELVLSQALLADGDTDGACAALRWEEKPGESVDGFHFDRFAYRVAVDIARSEIALRRGAVSQALDILDALHEAHPERRAATLAWIHGQVRGGRAEDALRNAVAYLRDYPGDRGGLLACAEAADALGMHERAQRWRAMAIG